MLHIKSMLLDFLYPPRCPVCDGLMKSSKERCHKACEKKLPWVHGAVCMKCGKPIADTGQEYCYDCSRMAHQFDQGTAPFIYSGVLRHRIYQLKVNNRREHLDFFAEAMTEYFRKHQTYWRPDLIASVPMHRSRRRKRGYNQADLLAKRISSLTGISYDREFITCVRRTKIQKELGRRERLVNLRGCFRIQKEVRPGMRILVVDDVYTTGSTMDEISRILKKAGAECVFFVVLCTGKEKNTVCTAQKL